MLDALRARLAWAAALRAVRRRPAPTPGARLEGRRLLAVLPAEAGRAAWDLLRRVDLPPAQVRLVALGLTSPPDAFAGRVEVLAARDWRGLPTPGETARARAFQPDVALNLADPSDSAALVLVGASGAAVRIGGHDAASEAGYDLLLAGPAGPPDPDALGRLLARLAPPVLPLR